MTKLAILTEAKRQRFDSPPRFDANAQIVYFSLNNDLLYILRSCHTPTSKAGFLLQFGYFRSHGKFYTADQFRQQDISYVVNLLGLDAHQIAFRTVAA